MYDPCLCGDPECPSCGPWYAERDAEGEEAALTLRRMRDDAAARAAPACACCGRPCRQGDASECLACTLLGEDETDDSELWNYPEQHHDHD